MANDRLTTADAAKLAGVATSTIKRWADQGLIRFTRTAGGHRRYTRAVVERMLHGENSESSDLDVDHWLDCLIRLDLYQLQSRLVAERAERGSWKKVVDILDQVFVELDRRVERREVDATQRHGIWEGLRRGINRISDGLPLSPKARVCVLVAAQDRTQGLALSLAELCLRETGWQPIWMGSQTSPAAIQAALTTYGPEAVMADASGFGCSGNSPKAWAVELGEMCRKAETELYLTGSGGWPLEVSYGSRLNRWNEMSQIATGSEC